MLSDWNASDGFLRRKKSLPAASDEKGGDERLGRLMKDILRHKAKDTPYKISPDGWMAVEDVLSYANSFEGNPGLDYDEAAVRQEVAENPKRRFQLHDTNAGTFIRAAQGHTMHGVGEEIGTLLTRATAPAVAVHGTFHRDLDKILQEGLSRMGRHHVHLARGLLGERGVVSGMRKNTEVYVWVNVHAAMDSGIRFFESENGVILCEGFDGLLAPSFFSVVIEVLGGLTLEAPHVRLIERLFAGCSRVTVKKMHGGFSGSLVLRTDSYDADGHPEEPTVTKLDDGDALVREVHETDYISELAGSDAIRVLRGPDYVNQRGEVIEIEEQPGSSQGGDPQEAARTRRRIQTADRAVRVMAARHRRPSRRMPSALSLRLRSCCNARHLLPTRTLRSQPQAGHSHRRSHRRRRRRSRSYEAAATRSSIRNHASCATRTRGSEGTARSSSRWRARAGFYPSLLSTWERSSS